VADHSLCICGSGPYHKPECPCQAAYMRAMSEPGRENIAGLYPPATWRSISNRHRAIARMPENETPDQTYKRLGLSGACALPGFYMRVYAHVEGNAEELTLPEWCAWRAAGGRSA